MPHLDSFLPLILIQLVLLQNPGFISKEGTPVRIQMTETGINLNVGEHKYPQDSVPLWQQLLSCEVSWYVIVFLVVSVFDLNCIRGQEHCSLRWAVYVII